MESKICAACKENKRNEEFYTQRYETLTGPRAIPAGYCRPCSNAYGKKYRVEVKERNRKRREREQKLLEAF